MTKLMSEKELQQKHSDTVVATVLNHIKVDYEVTTPNCHLYSYSFSKLMGKSAIEMVQMQNGLNFTQYLADFLFNQWTILKIQDH